ncbi:hypothetical protein SAMN04515671_2936 [Nakamurella panacisegetis]|uniref:Uncharacterized protein n=1 Tax=Nakamurella panacisegetis TaxID=1090615 RepID=A0A1H0Q010_9ACTN|nr:hypothetical protein [Nakamurella panacisegetis]SDP10076.1 hypothetical protein SAMN04515671_2936 [Nakamurella panacisegetis]
MIETCIRGCRQPDPAGLGRPTPSPRWDWYTAGQLCERCTVQLWGWLGSIERDYLTLSTEILDSGPQERTNTGAPGASPAPLRLDVLALLDPRTTLDPEDRASVTYPPAAVRAWAANLLELTGDDSPIYTLGGALSVLQDPWYWPQLLAAPFLTDCYDEIRAITTALNRAHDRDRAIYLGPCVSSWLPRCPPWSLDWIEWGADTEPPELEGPLDYCLAPVYRAGPDTPITCHTCGRRYGPRDVLALAESTLDTDPEEITP